MKRFALDWFECGVVGSSDAISYLANQMRTLYGAVDSGSSRFYDLSVCSPEHGLTFQYGVKPGLKNSPAYFRLSGQYFKNHNAEFLLDELFVIIDSASCSFKITRIDACVDFISAFGDVDIVPVPEPVNDNTTFKTISDSDGVVETYFSGKSDVRIRVYNKLVESPDYGSVYGIFEPVFEVWRAEIQLRGESLQNILEKEFSCSGSDFDTYSLIMLGIGQLARRCHIPGFDMTPSDHSGYSKREVNVAEQFNYWQNRMLSAKKRLVALCSENSIYAFDDF